MRTVVLRVAALALLLLLAIVAAVTVRTLQRLPDTTLYLVRGEATTLTLEPVHRTLRSRGADPEPPSVAAVRAAVAALADGPTAQEAARGLSSEVPRGTEVLDARLDGTILTLDLSGDFVAGGGTASMLARLHQVRYTAVRPGAITAVSLYVDGAPLTVLGGEGIMVESVWSPSSDALPRW